MSSDSDGGECPRGWTLVDKHGHAEDSEDSSGSSSDFVDLGEDSVRYHHVSRSSSVIDIAPGNSASRPASSSSLPANYRAHGGAVPSPEEHLQNLASSRADSTTPTDLLSLPGIPDEAEIIHSDTAVRPRNYGNSCPGSHRISPRRARVEGMPVEEWNPPNTANSHPSDVEKSTSSSCSTLTGSRSPLPFSFPNALANSGDLHKEDDLQAQGPANFLPSVNTEKLDDAETDVKEQPASNISDNVSVDSIEVLSMPHDDESHFLEDGEAMQGYGEIIEGGMEEVKDENKLAAVPALFSMAGVIPERDVIRDCSNEPQSGSLGEESDTSEFERIDAEMVQSVEMENQTNEVAEEDKMDVAGARPTEELKEETIWNDSFLRPTNQPPNFQESRSLDTGDVYNPFLQPLSLSPPISPIVSEPPTRHAAKHPWSGQSVPAIQPFPLDQLPADMIGHRQRASSSESSGLHHQPPIGFGLPRQHGSSSSEEVFELVQRPPLQDDDAASVVSSSSSDLSGFVNVRQRRGPPLSRSVSQRHSDFDDMLDSVSNFTDVSEDCLPANMTIQRQKSGVRQYRHHRDEGFNTRLDWLVAMVLLAGLALGIGHFIGSTQEMAHQHSINTGQVQRLRELQDDLVTCLDRTSGIDSRITTERSSPALQAVKLLEGLNSKMLGEELDTSHLLEQKVGPADMDAKGAHSKDAVLHLNENDAGMKGLEVHEEATGKDVMDNQPGNLIGSSESQVGERKDSSEALEPEYSDKAKEDDAAGSKEDNSVADEVADASVVPDEEDEVAIESFKDEKIKDQEKIAEETKSDISSDFNEGEISKGQQLRDGDDDERATKNFEKKHPDIDIATISDRNDKVSNTAKSVNEANPAEISNANQEASTVEVLQRKIELMEEKMDAVMKTAQHWQEMLEESKRVKSSEDDQSKTQHTDNPESSDEDRSKTDGTQDEQDPLVGIAATLESLWPGLLKTNQGKAFLHYLNLTKEQSVLWSEAVYRELDALKSLPDSEEVQAIMNNTKLFALHLGKEIKSVTGYLRNQSARLVEENNITVEGIGLKASSAWTKLTNVTSDVIDYNKWVLSYVGEHLTDTLHTVENISAEIISQQNLSVSSASNMVEQIWGTVKNYSSLVTDTILNKTSESAKNSRSAFDDSETASYEKTSEFDDNHSDSDSDESSGSGLGEKLKGAWDAVRNYSANFTSKQNLSISGLREQVKAAWGKVKNTSAQVIEDISESNLAEKLKDGAKKLGDKVGTTFRAVKEKVKGFHNRKGRHEKKKRHYDRSDGHHKTKRWTEKKQHKKKHRGCKRRDKHKDREEFQSEKDKEEESEKKQHSGHHKNEWHQTGNRHHPSNSPANKPGRDDEQKEHGEQYSVPSRGHRLHDSELGTTKSHTLDKSSGAPQSEQDQGFLYSVPSRPQSMQLSQSDIEESLKQDAAHRKQDQPLKQDQQNSLPSRQQMKQPMKMTNERNQDQPRSDDRQDRNSEVRDKGCPTYLASLESKENGERNGVSNWEELFDCVDMHCKGNEECMHSQRQDAARLYSELLDYQEWLKQRNLRKDVRELKEFLEELGEFLSETDSDDRDLDELKDEFGEMVQDMEERALKRLRKRDKLHQTQVNKPLNTDKEHDAQQQEVPAAINNPDEDENSTVIIDLKTLPQQHSKPNQPHFSSQTPHSEGKSERRKYAGRGFHSTGEDNDWYLQRAKDRADQRQTHHLMGDENHRDTPNWYLHWVQGRINGRTGVTVWDMYEWIKERYMLREELRQHEMEDHTNWFLRRP